MHLEEHVIGDYIDEALDPSARVDVEQHLDACEECRRLVADFREIRATAASLEPRDPPVRVWSRIERAIQLDAEHRIDVDAEAKQVDRPWGVRRWAALTGLAAAAVLVLATLVGARFGVWRPKGPEGVPAERSASSGEAAQSVEAELRAAEAHYERAIRGLEQIASAEKAAFDPATAAALQRNLAVIDQAINESRAAIRAQPSSEPARESLIENFKIKLGLLQDTVALINEIRKGDEAGAARIVSGLNEKGR